MAARWHLAAPISRCKKNLRLLPCRFLCRLCAGRAFRSRSPLVLPLRSNSSASHRSQLAPQWLLLPGPLNVVEKVHQRGVEASGLGEVRAMSRIGNHDFFGSGNMGRQSVSGSGDEWNFVIADYDQRRNFKVSELGDLRHRCPTGFRMWIEQVLAGIRRPQSAIAIRHVGASCRYPADYAQDQFADGVETILFGNRRQRGEQLSDFRGRGKALRERAVKYETRHPVRKCGCESESDAATT